MKREGEEEACINIVMRMGCVNVAGEERRHRRGKFCQKERMMKFCRENARGTFGAERVVGR